MLSGESNAGERWKTTIGLISKKSNFARAAHFFCTFLCRCFARLQRETSRNFLVTRFMEEMSYVFSFTFFFTAAHFLLALVAASISHFVTAATKFSCCSSNKKCLLCFLSLALDLCCPFSRWASLACRLLSLFLGCLSPALYFKFVDMTMAAVTSGLLTIVKTGITIVSYFGKVTVSLFALTIVRKFTPRCSKTIQTNYNYTQARFVG